MAMAADESLCMLIRAFLPKSAISCINPIACAAVLDNACDSASAELNAMVCCVLDHVLTTWLPNRSTPPDVLSALSFRLHDLNHHRA